MILLFGTDRDPLTTERLKYMLFSTKSLLLFEPPRIRVGSITVITHLKDNFGEQGIILGEYF